MIKINKKKVLSLLTAGLISLSHIPHTLAEVKTEGDSIKATSNVNVRTNNGFDGEIIGRLPKNSVAKRIFSYDNGWSLIEYNHQLGFVKDEFTKDVSDINIYCNVDFTECRKILLTANDTFMHLDPFDEADKISKISSLTSVDVLAYATNDWYLVNYKGKLGFVSGRDLTDNYQNYTRKMVKASSDVNIRSHASTKSKKYNILYQGDELPYLGEEKDFYIVDYYGVEAYVSKKYSDMYDKEYKPVDFIKLVCVNDDTFLFSAADYNSNINAYIDQYETGEVLWEEGDYYFIRTHEMEGYIHKGCVTDLKGMVVVIDISEQKLYVYQDNSIIFTTNVVTGKNKTPTPLEKCSVELKQKDRYLIGENYQCYVNNWVQFDGNYGIHDYESQKGNFGGDIYKKNGSHGCVRMHIIPMEKFYQLVKVKTPVIIHK